MSAGHSAPADLLWPHLQRKNLEPAKEQRECCLMGNSQGRDNVKKRASRRKKTERLAAAKKSEKKKTK
jgi:hypothetical protein